MPEKSVQYEQRLLLDDYRSMAADEEHERDARDWCEALASDGVSAAEADDPHTS